MRGLARLVLAATLVLSAGCGDARSSALRPQSSAGEDIARLWWLMLGLGAAVAVLVIGLLLRTARSSRRPDDEDGNRSGDGQRWIVLGGVVLPVVVLLPLSLVVVRTGARVAAPPPEDALVVDVVGHQYWWEIRYPESGAAVTANEMHIPVGRAVDLRLTTDDVIHSFWVPPLHGKVDMIPGEETRLTLNADEAGTYQGVCAEFCGLQHANMRFLVVAEEPDEFARWLGRQAVDAPSPPSPEAAAGQDAFLATGCASCHTVRGTEADGQVGPDLTHFASRQTLGSGVVENNRGNLGGWIADPQGIKPGSTMPPSVLDPDELLGLIAYLEALE